MPRQQKDPIVNGVENGVDASMIPAGDLLAAYPHKDHSLTREWTTLPWWGCWSPAGRYCDQDDSRGFWLCDVDPMTGTMHIVMFNEWMMLGPTGY